MSKLEKYLNIISECVQRIESNCEEKNENYSLYDDCKRINVAINKIMKILDDDLK